MGRGVFWSKLDENGMGRTLIIDALQDDSAAYIRDVVEPLAEDTGKKVSFSNGTLFVEDEDGMLVEFDSDHPFYDDITDCDAYVSYEFFCEDNANEFVDGVKGCIQGAISRLNTALSKVDGIEIRSDGYEDHKWQNVHGTDFRLDSYVDLNWLMQSRGDFETNFNIGLHSDESHLILGIFPEEKTWENTENAITSDYNPTAKYLHFSNSEFKERYEMMLALMYETIKDELHNAGYTMRVRTSGWTTSQMEIEGISDDTVDARIAEIASDFSEARFLEEIRKEPQNVFYCEVDLEERVAYMKDEDGKILHDAEITNDRKLMADMTDGTSLCMKDALHYFEHRLAEDEVLLPVEMYEKAFPDFRNKSGPKP